MICSSNIDCGGDYCGDTYCAGIFDVCQNFGVVAADTDEIGNVDKGWFCSGESCDVAAVGSGQSCDVAAVGADENCDVGVMLLHLATKL